MNGPEITTMSRRKQDNPQPLRLATDTERK